MEQRHIAATAVDERLEISRGLVVTRLAPLLPAFA